MNHQKRNRKVKQVMVLLIMAVFTLTTIMPPAFAAAPTWWPEVREAALADALGAMEGFMATDNGVGAIYAGVLASLHAAHKPGDTGNGWQPQAPAPLSIGYHHNMAMEYIMRNMGPLDFKTSAGRARAEQLLLAYLDNNVVERFISSGGAPDGSAGRAAEPFFKIGSISGDPENPASAGSGSPVLQTGTYQGSESLNDGYNPQISDILKRLETERNRGSISNTFYQNILITMEILRSQGDNPDLLMDTAVDYLLREERPRRRVEVLTSIQDAGTLQESLSLNFEKLVVTYKEHLQREAGENVTPADITLNKATRDALDIIVVVPGRGAGISPQVEVREFLAASVFLEVLSESYRYHRHGVVPTTPEQEPQLRIIMTIGNTAGTANGRPIATDVAPFIRDGRTLLPFRFIGEQLGAQIDWDAIDRKVTYTLGTRTVSLWIDQNLSLVNGRERLVDPLNPNVVPIIRDGRTMVPVRFISEALGFTVDWNGETQQVTVSGNNPLYTGSGTSQSNPLFGN